MNELTNLVVAFERLWANGSSPDLDAFLSGVGAVDSAELSRLARIDQGERWQRGERRSAEEYLDRYPALEADHDSAVDLIYHEYLLREKRAERPSLDEFTDRFPQHATVLAEQVGLHRALTDATEYGSTDYPPSTETTPTPQLESHWFPKLPTQFGRYRVLALLGRGAMGNVYLAEDSQLGRQVALKLPRLDRDESPEAFDRFRREARIAATFHHPNLCPVYDFGELEGMLFLTMPCISGKPLSARLQAGPLPEKLAAQIALKIARAMSVAHRAGVVHRDLKPANIVLREGDEPVVMDFGLARRNLDLDPKLIGSGALVGTLAYMAPEQLGSNGDENGPASDVYSLGVILYEMLTGRPPFAGSWKEVWEQIRSLPPTAPAEHASAISSAVNEICLRALAKNPQDRIDSMEALADALAQIAEEGGDVPKRQRRFTILAVAVASIVAIVGWFAWQTANLRWARQQVPAIEKLVQAARIFEAYNLAVPVRKYLPGEPKLTRLMPAISNTLSVTSQPTGAQVYLSRYSATTAGAPVPRVLVGATPLSDLEIARDDYVVTLKKEGYDQFQRTISGATIKGLEGVFPPIQLDVTLTPVGEAPDDGMVFVPHGPSGGMAFVPRDAPAGKVVVLSDVSRDEYRLVAWQRPTDAKVKLDGYYIDKFEVTNREYREFVASGGYQNEQFWTQPFVKEGRPLTWQTAMREFIDRTGHAGPRGWSNGTYAEGNADHPVTDVTWYEAAAYAAFRGKSLPTIFQWEKAARNGVWNPVGMIMPWGFLQGPTHGRANFNTSGTVPVGSLEFGISPFGCYEMAGNVAEWCLNETSEGFITSGGSWDSPVYLFGYYGRYPGFFSSDRLGFRCALNRADATSDQGAFYIDIEDEIPQYDPEPEEKVRTWFKYYEYDKESPLDARVIEVRESDEWRREKIAYNGADGERALAHLYLPKNLPGPHQVIQIMPAGDVWYLKRPLEESIEGEYGPLLHSGRAVFSVVLRGFHEREVPGSDDPDPVSIEHVEVMARHIVDLRRGLDYLETRDDLDTSRIAYLQASAGGILMTLPAIETRYAAVILLGAGLRKGDTQVHSAASSIHFAPLIRQPKLLIHGRYDEGSPLTTVAMPLFSLLPMPKKMVNYDGGHRADPEDLVPTVRNWLDETLGPVKRK